MCFSNLKIARERASVMGRRVVFQSLKHVKTGAMVRSIPVVSNQEQMIRKMLLALINSGSSAYVHLGKGCRSEDDNAS